MPLIPQRASFPVTGGQEQGAAPELIDPPSLARAHNVVYSRQGELTKRRGWRVFDEETSTGDTLPYGDRLLAREDELVRVGEQRSNLWKDPVREPCRIYSRTAGETREEGTPRPWMAKGNVPRFDVARALEIAHQYPGSRIENFDVAFAGDALSSGVGESGVLCAIWQYDTGEAEERIDWATIDVATKTLIATGELARNVSSDRLIRVVALKGSDSLWYFHVYWGQGEFGGDPGDVELYHATMPAYRPWSWSATDTVSTDLAAYDVCVCAPSAVDGITPFERRLFIVTASTGGVVRCDLYRPGATGSYSSSAGDTVEELSVATKRCHCCCDPNGRHVAVAVQTNAGLLNLHQFNAALGPLGAVTLFASKTVDAIGTLNSRSVQVGWVGTSRDEAAALRYDNWALTWGKNSDGNTRVRFYSATTTPSDFLQEPRTAVARYFNNWSRIFSYRGDAYEVVLKGTSADAVTCEVLSWVPEWAEGEGLRAVISHKHARFGAGEIAFASGGALYDVPENGGRNSVVPSWYDPGRFITVVPLVSSDGCDHKLGVFFLDALESDEQQFSGAQLNGGLTIASGVPWLYDGYLGHELGFSHRPQSAAGEITAASAAVGPPYLAAATYYVAMCWEAVDSLGNVSRSAPSKTGPIVIGANANLSVTYRSLGYTSHRNARPVVYVSSDGGLNYYRSTEILTNVLDEITDTKVTLNPGLMFVTGAPTLYTDARILSNAPLVGARFACEWQGRIWLAVDNIVWPSREVIYGEEPSFNESMQFRVPADVAGIASLDDRLAIFCRERIYWIAGDGPTDTGEGGSFTQPQRVASDFGCVDARSIVRCDKGILFQSRRGIELLGRALDTSLVSGGIDKLLRDDGYSEVVASSLDPKNQLVRFVLRAPSSGAFIIACWHVLFGLWTTHSVPQTYSNPDVGNLPFGIVHAVGRNWMTLNDRPGMTVPYEPLAMELEIEDSLATRYLDGGTPGTGYWYGVTLETANIKLDGLLGFVRVWRAYIELKNQSAHTGVSLGYCVDYSIATSGTSYWTTAADIASGLTASANHRLFATHIGVQQCSAVRLVINEQQETGLTPPAVAGKNTYLTFVGFGVEFGQKPGTGRGSEGSKK